MRKCVMGKRMGAFLMVLFLTAGAIQTPVQAETNSLQTETVTLTDENRYNPEYYKEPEVRYPMAAKARTFRAAGEELTLEEYIVEALENFETEIDVSAYNVPKATASDEFFRILNDNPQLFYVKSEHRVSFYQGASTIRAYEVTYLYDEDTVIQMTEELETVVEQVIDQVDTSLPEYQQALIVHDYLVQNCEYDYENYIKEPGGIAVPEISHTVYGSMVNRIAVCDGYADALVYILELELGIPCDVVSSQAMGHAWNMIEIDGEWYHVDATWDDPAWDCIGRVGHAYFLNSDSKISNNSPNAKHPDPKVSNHYLWSAEDTADSTKYDNAFWADVNSAICYYNDAWYYSKYQDVSSSPTADALAKAVKLVKKDGEQLLTGSEDVVYSTSVWSAEEAGYFVPASYMYLAQAYDRIYFNTRTEIYEVGTDGSVEKFYSPADLAGNQICGFTVRGKEFWYAPRIAPSNQKQTDIRKFSLKSISGISAADVTGTYNGHPYTIEVTGTQEGDIVQYEGEDGHYHPDQPQMVDAGTYEVRYRVERDGGYVPFSGKATVTIGQAVPEYKIPTGLKGYIGDTLASVALPEGFSWQTPATRLEGLGTKKYKVKYVPADKNFKTVSDIEVDVEQECPGHIYTSKITTLPTEEQNGEETFTCTLCGHFYTQEIDKDQPALTGITAEDVKGVYSGSAYTITVTGLQENDTVSYAINDGVYREEQPEIKNAGVYNVSYRVAREGHQPFYGSARVEITRAVPQYTVPANLKGNSGALLGSVKLPQGFIWQTDPNTRLGKEGYNKFSVIYIPTDQVNYQQVLNIEVTIQVTCPGHQYDVVINKNATETETGLKTYTCKLCGKSYTEEISMLSPARPSRVTGLKVTNRTTNSLSYSWNKVQGVGCRLMFYKGEQIISEQYTTGNTFTFTRLQSATVYTLKVTPYRIVNNNNVYASSTRSVRSATAPVKARLSTANRIGKNKIRLTWKRDTGVTGYAIFMKIGNGDYKKVKTVGKAGTLSFTKTGLNNKKTYSFRMRGYITVDGKKIYGAYSNVIKVR